MKQKQQKASTMHDMVQTIIQRPVYAFFHVRVEGPLKEADLRGREVLAASEALLLAAWRLIKSMAAAAGQLGSVVMYPLRRVMVFALVRRALISDHEQSVAQAPKG